MSKNSRRLIPILVLASLCSLALASSASAATITFDGNVLHYTAAPGEANNGIANVSQYSTACAVAAPCLNIQDWQHINYPTNRCALYWDGGPWGQQVSCQIPTSMVVSLGDLEDAWFDWDGPSVIDGGTGNDNPLTGNGGNDTINGGPGDDLMLGGFGDDTLNGGPGNDYHEGVAYEGAGQTQGRDTYIGGGGGDVVNYADRTEDMNISLDGAANDGAAGEGDNVGADIAGVRTGPGNDTLTGNDNPNLLVSGGGNDVITGAGGDDSIDGQGGHDRIDGGDGQDAIGGGNDDDVIIGGPGLDSLFGEEPGASCLPGTCDGGRDQIFSRDGLGDYVDCGPGLDWVQGDLIDNFEPATCETGELAGAGGGGAGGGAPGGGGKGGGAAGGGAAGAGGGAGGNGLPNPGAPQLAVAGAKVDKGRIQVQLGVPGPGALDVHATARTGKRNLEVGRAAKQVGAAGEVTVPVKPTRAALKVLKAGKALPVSVLATFTPAGGGKAITQRQTVALRAGKGRK